MKKGLAKSKRPTRQATKRTREGHTKAEPPKVTIYRDSGTGAFITGATSSVSISQTPVDVNPFDATPIRKDIERAVFGYIRAMRALGHTKINTTTIADALSLPITEVNRVVARLQERGVRPL